MNPCEDRPAPYENYLYVYECQTGDEFFKELKDDDLLDVETQIIHWVKEHFAGEAEIDFPLCDFEGDYHASIKTDFNSPDSVIVWESAGFYLK